MQWPKEKVQKDKQLSTKHTYKRKDRVTRTPLKTGGELRCSRRVGSFCSTSDTRHVNLVTNPVINMVQYGQRKFTLPGRNRKCANFAYNLHQLRAKHINDSMFIDDIVKLTLVMSL
jgi:hypothetical protein